VLIKEITSIFQGCNIKLLLHKLKIIVQSLLTYGAKPFLGSCKLCSYSRTSQHFMELEVSLPY
jgi:hypothetical protein